MKSTLKLTQQAYILIAVPLIVGVALLAELQSLQYETEREVARESNARASVAHLNKLMVLFTEAVGGVTAFMFTGKKNNLKHFNEIRDQVLHEYSSLEKLLKDKPEELASVIAMETNAGRWMGSLTEAMDSAETDNHIESFQILRTNKHFLDEIRDELLKILAKEEVAEQASAKNLKTKHEAVQQLLLAGIAANVLMAILLAAFFNTRTTKRLQSVMINILRLADKKPLLPQLEGNDELATLDKVFRQMTTELEEAAAYKQGLMQMVAHDLRSPLTSIQATMTMLRAGALGELPVQADGAVESAQRSVASLIKLIQDLLDVERLEAGKLDIKPEVVPVSWLFERTIDMLGASAEEKKITIDYPDECGTVYGDQERLLQVLSNLVSNAIKFSPEGGMIKLTVKQANGRSEISVIDFGSGIPAAFIDKVFNRFQQVSGADQQTGSGLGLAICKAIIESHGGEIGVTSQKGKGSTFSFSLPTPP